MSNRPPVALCFQRYIYRRAILAMMFVIAVATACASGGPCPACASFDALRWCNDSGGTACSAEVPTGSCGVSSGRPFSECWSNLFSPSEKVQSITVPVGSFRDRISGLPIVVVSISAGAALDPLDFTVKFDGVSATCPPSQTGTIVTFQCDAPPGLATLGIECRRATMRVQPSFRFVERGCREPLLTCKSEP